MTTDTDRDRMLHTHESRVAAIVDALTPREKVLLVALASMGAASNGDSLAAMLGAAAQPETAPASADPTPRAPRTARATEAGIAWAAARRDGIVDAVRRLGACTSTEIATALKCDVSTVTVALRDLVASGRVCRGRSGDAAWSTRYAMTQAEADDAARAAKFTVKRPGCPSAAAAKVLAEPASYLGGQGANASTTSSDRADSAAPSEPVERPRLEEAADLAPFAAASSPPMDDDEALDSERPVRTLAEMISDEAAEERARRDRVAAEAQRRASLARSVPVPPFVPETSKAKRGGAA